MKNIGEVLKSERLDRNLTITEVSKKLKDINIKASVPYISMIENNKTKPTSKYLYNFVKVILDNINSYSYYHYVVAERYIKLSMELGIDIDKSFPNVKDVLVDRGMWEDNRYLDKPYYNLNWLLNQNKQEVVIGVRTTFEFDEVSSLKPLELRNIFKPMDKVFYKLDDNDKKFILNVISNLIMSKVGHNGLIDLMDTEYNKSILNSHVFFDHEKLYQDLELLDFKNDND